MDDFKSDDNPDQPQEFVVTEQDLEGIPQELLGSEGLPPMPEASPEPAADAAPAEMPVPEPEGSDIFATPDPNENSNPAIAVEEMLSAVVPLEANTSAAESLAPSSEPSFRVRLDAIPEAKREPLRPILTEIGLSAQDANSSSFSRLTEFQMLRLLQGLREIGIVAHVEVTRPGLMQSEEEEALGGIFPPEGAPPAESEGAPSVGIPGHEKDVLLVTGEALPGFFVLETRGIVSAHRSIARRFFREQELQEQMEREIRRYPGKGLSLLPKSAMERLFRELFLDLQKNALSVGANAVVSLHIDTFPETTHLDPGLEQMRLVALGTAAVVEKLPT